MPTSIKPTSAAPTPTTSPSSTLSASISTTGNFQYIVNATGTNLRKVWIFAAKTTADLTQASSWTLVNVNNNCAGSSNCSVTGSWTYPWDGQSYYIVANAQDNNGHYCSGNPVTTDPPNPRCGSNDILTVLPQH
jgi:hypothetical protein